MVGLARCKAGGEGVDVAHDAVLSVDVLVIGAMFMFITCSVFRYMMLSLLSPQ